ncbi:hypothetical protein THRCLA_01053 [Thraustotheca clavata]|uniref:TBC1 domain family member 31 n=1 Tax=Thraustotheca clavata TaxID=74557 RepID=A0A1W0A9R1_9STRA|nr:hypothetical protein THRCLA_01053 [Thraustotheca clavata]
MVYEVRLKLSADEESVLWPRRPQVGASGLLGCMRNLPLRAYKATDEAMGSATFRCVAFSPSGDLFAAVDEKGRVFAFFPTRNRYSLVCHLGTAAIECAFSPEQRGELLITCEDCTVRCVNVQSKVLISTLRGHRHAPRCVSFQRPGKLALTASADAVILWDSTEWTRFRTLNAGPGVEAASFIGNGELVAVCFRDDSILMWELSTLALQYRFTLPNYEHPPGLKRFCVSESSRAIIASGVSPFIYVWEFESQTLIRIIELPSTVKRVFQHSFVPCTSNIISVLGDDGQLNFLNVTTKQPKVSLQISNRTKALTQYDIDSNGKYLAACTSDGCLLLYDLDIARETALKVQVRQNADIEQQYLSTRSSIPAPELMDSLFGHQTKPFAKEAAPLESQLEPSPPLIKPKTQSPPTISFTDRKNVQLQKKRLAQLLRSYQAYPERYRMLAWRYLLELPENMDAFTALLNKGPHPSFIRLEKQYPIHNQRLFRRLQRVLSAIAYWCPAFGEADYLPSLVFPFVKVCENNDLMAFEVTLTFLLHWGRDFLVRYPYPPLHLLRVLEKELERRDPQLYLHFVDHNIQSETYGWSLVRSVFSEVLSRSNWLCLWDHLVTAFEDPGRIWSAVLAFLQISRSIILNLSSTVALESFFHTQQSVDMRLLIEWLEQMTFPLPAPLSTDPALVPLAKGNYPVFRQYPHFVVDYQIEERNRIAREEAELAAKESLLFQLQKQTEALENAHRRWMEDKQHWLESEQSRRLEALEREKQRIVEMKILHAKTRERRLQQIIMMEKNAKEALETTSKLLQAEHDRYAVEMDFAKQKQADRATHLMDDEEIATIESAALQRIQKLSQDRVAEERLQKLRMDFFAQCRQQELADQMVFDRWKDEDHRAVETEQQKTQQQHEEAMKAQEDLLHSEWQQKLSMQAMERAQTIRSLARAREERKQSQPTDLKQSISSSIPSLEPNDDFAPIESYNSSAISTPAPRINAQHLENNSEHSPTQSMKDANMETMVPLTEDNVLPRTTTPPHFTAISTTFTANTPTPMATTPLATAPLPFSSPHQSPPISTKRTEITKSFAPLAAPSSSISSSSSVASSSEQQKLLLQRAMEEISSDEEDEMLPTIDPPPLKNHRLSVLEQELKKEFSDLGSDVDSLEQRPLSDLERDLDSITMSKMPHSVPKSAQVEKKSTMSAPVSRAPSPVESHASGFSETTKKLLHLQSKLSNLELKSKKSDEGILGVGDVADIVVKPSHLEPYERDQEHERLMARAKALLHQYHS